MKDKRVHCHRQLDNLIDFYVREDRAVSSVKVSRVRATIMRWGIKPTNRGGPLIYRGFTLVPKEDGRG